VAAEFLLNEVVRPCTSRWHRWLVDHRFNDERARRQFRYELKQLLPQLTRFAELFGLMVAGPQENEKAKTLFGEIVAATPRAGRPADLGGSVEAGIGREVRFAEGPLVSPLGRFAEPEEINAAEQRFLHRRRQAFGDESTVSAPSAPKAAASQQPSPVAGAQ